MSFFETSAKTNQNVNEVFNYLTKEILKSNVKEETGGKTLDAKNTKSGKKGCCK